jgi:hypothetical protein
VIAKVFAGASAFVVFISVLLSILSGLTLTREVPDLYGSDGLDAVNRLNATGFHAQPAYE